MIIVMDLKTTAAQQLYVKRQAKRMCQKISVSIGEGHLIIGLIGLKATANEEHLRTLPGVQRVIRIDTKYKLVSITATNGVHSTVTIGEAMIGNGLASVIAGNCSVESYDLVMATIEPMLKAGLLLARGDAWKHRTSVNDFQGLGVKALRILEQVTAETGMPFVVEVLNPRHIKQCLDHGIAALRIGTRNAQNFALIRAAARSGLPLILKRGMSMKYDEWLNAAEYAAMACPNGDIQIILCERGIRTFEDATRNTLDVAAIPMIHRLSHLPIIGDPSHAGGDSDLAIDLALSLMGAGADGLQMDVHIDPSQARCDGPQAIRPEQFTRLMPALTNYAALRGIKLVQAA